MKSYELTYLISLDLSEEEMRVFQEKINSSVRAEGGICLPPAKKSSVSLNISGEVNKPAKKRLTYPIQKSSQAYLATLNFQLNPENLASLEKKLKAENQILRYIILSKPSTKEILVRGKPPEKIIRTPPSARTLISPRLKPKQKVELKEIEKKLEEILGE